jgi:Tfp pilus assembly protein PilZ
VIRVELNLEDKGRWVKVFDPRDFTILLAGEKEGRIGDAVRVDLTISGGGPKVILRGKVLSHRDQPSGSAPAGTIVALGPEEREKINYLNGFVRGGLLNLRERRRLPLRLPVTYGGVNGPQKSFTRDINEEGVFVVTEEPLPEESEIHLLIQFPDHDEPVAIAGRVGHTVVIEDEDVPGMGILFKADDGKNGELAELVDELEGKFLAGSLPDDVLL